MVKVAITGSTGLIGSRIVELLTPDFIFIPLTSKNLDITSSFQVQSTLQSFDYDILVHLAGYTNVDKAESTERDLAHKINVEGTHNLFSATQVQGKKFIFISTEFVFDGTNPPYYEDSPTNPLNYYGQNKVESEELIKDKGMIVRLSSPYRKDFAMKKDIVRTVKSLLEQGKSLKMVSDSSFTPTYIDDIAFAFKYLLNNFSPEIFHIVGADSFSPYEAGKLIARAFDLDESLVQPTTYEEYFKDKALRPRYAQVKSKKNDFCMMKTFEEGLTALRK